MREPAGEVASERGWVESEDRYRFYKKGFRGCHFLTLCIKLVWPSYSRDTGYCTNAHACAISVVGLLKFSACFSQVLFLYWGGGGGGGGGMLTTVNCYS